MTGLGRDRVAAPPDSAIPANAGSPMLVSEDDVDQATGHDDHLAGLLAVDQCGGAHLRQRCLAHLVRTRRGGHHHPGADLAVDLDRVLDGVLNQVALLRFGHRPVRQRLVRSTIDADTALALRISSLTDPGQPARYVMDLIDLGRLGQRICLAGAELGIGVFLTPAVHDRGACSLLGLADAERRLT